LAASDWHKSLSEGLAEKVKRLQKDYLVKAEEIINESSNLEVKKNRDKIAFKFKVNVDPKAEFSQEEKDILKLAKEPTTLDARKSLPIKISINAPIDEVFTRLRLSGYIHPIKDKSISNSYLDFHTDFDIVSHFNLVIHRLLSWYSGASNFIRVKGLAHLLRSSCVLTLANKHKKSKNWVYIVYGSEVTVLNGKKKIQLKSRTSILNYSNNFNLKSDSSFTNYYDSNKIISLFNKSSHGIQLFFDCSVTNCLKIK
jgi:hypothetical protein